MKTAVHAPLPLLPLLLALAAATDAAAETAAIAMTQALEIDGDPVQRALVGVAAPTGPSLPFHVALDFRCPADTQRGELFVSIADTAQILDATGIPSPQTVRIEVPLRQLQWLTDPAHGCGNVSEQRPPDEVDQDGTRYFRVHAGAAGYATVTCLAKDGATSAATSSAPLDVWLSCPAPGAAADSR